MRTLIATALLLLVPAGLPAAESRPLVSVSTSPYAFEAKPLNEHPVIPRVGLRELGRQAVLLSLREEFGCSTRDQSLAESLGGEGELPIEALVEPRHGLGLRIALTHDGEMFCDEQAGFAIGPVFTCQRLARKLEPLTTGALADALASLGLERRPNQQVDSAPLPDDAEQLLLVMDHVSQFRALRAIHTAIRESGESPERLDGLARGYANLAMLHFTTLDARSAAYRGRAMLYAERLKNRAADPQLARWTEAYVYTLAGFPSIALDCLDAKAGDEANPASPEWLAVVVDGCRHRFDRLGERAMDAGDPLRQLAALLWMRSAWVSGSKVLAIQTGGQCLSAAPGCLWVADAVNSSAGVAMQHSSSVLGPTLHGWLLKHMLPQVEGLPETVAAGADDRNQPLSIFETADAARGLMAAAEGDAQEPSWGALGADIHAWATLHVFRRGQFLRHELGVDASDFIDASDPVIAGNHWAPAIRTLRIAPTNRAAPYNRMLRDFTLRDTNTYSSRSWIDRIPKTAELENGPVKALHTIAVRASDGTEMEFARRVTTSNVQGKVTNAKWMYDCSRHAPVRIATLIRYDASMTDEQVDEWSQEYGSHPVVSLAIGQRLSGRGEIDQAMAYYYRYLEQAPDPAVYTNLARMQYWIGDDRWQETLEEIRTHPDYSLSHANAERRIAATLLQERRFEEALPWAQAASESGAGWAYVMECECLAALGRYEEAVELAQVCSQRYQDDAWYTWIALTGVGDIDTAWRNKRLLLRRQFEKDHRSIAIAARLQLLIEGKRKECMELALDGLEPTGNHWDMLTSALLADETGDAETRDTWLAHEADRQDLERPHPYTLLARKFRDALAGGEFDEQSVQEIAARERGGASWVSPLHFFAAWFLSNRGETDRATELYKQAACAAQPEAWARILTYRALREEGVDPFTIEGRRIPYALRAPAKAVEPDADPAE